MDIWIHRTRMLVCYFRSRRYVPQFAVRVICDVLEFFHAGMRETHTGARAPGIKGNTSYQVKEAATNKGSPFDEEG